MQSNKVKPIETFDYRHIGSENINGVGLKLLYSDLSEPEYMTLDEMREHNVVPSFNEELFYKKLSNNEDIDLTEHFDYGHSYDNSIDEIALELISSNRKFRISKLKLAEEGIALSDHDNQIEIFVIAAAHFFMY